LPSDRATRDSSHPSQAVAKNFASIAAAPDDAAKYHGYGEGDNFADAKAAALRSCGNPSCEIMFNYKGGECLSMVLGDTNLFWNTEQFDTTEEMQERVLNYCGKNDTGCRPIKKLCLTASASTSVEPQPPKPVDDIDPEFAAIAADPEKAIDRYREGDRPIRVWRGADAGEGQGSGASRMWKFVLQDHEEFQEGRVLGDGFGRWRLVLEFDAKWRRRGNSEESLAILRCQGHGLPGCQGNLFERLGRSVRISWRPIKSSALLSSGVCLWIPVAAHHDRHHVDSAAGRPRRTGCGRPADPPIAWFQQADGVGFSPAILRALPFISLLTV
jgi:hypothetical protein